MIYGYGYTYAPAPRRMRSARARALRERQAGRPVAFDGTRDGRARVGFLSPIAQEAGGTESWHAALIPRLSDKIRVVGMAIANNGQCWPGTSARLGIPVAEGPGAALELCRSVDVLVAWGMANLPEFLPERNRPAVAYVSHGDGASDWNRDHIRGAQSAVDRFVGVSGAALEAVPECRRKDAVVILNAYDPAKIEASRTREFVRRREIGVGFDRHLVLYNGRMSYEKGPETVPRMLALLPRRFVAVMAGDGYEADAVRRAIDREGVADRCLMLGTRSDTGDLLAAADWLVNPSTSEGFGLSMAEAMAAGVPVLSHRVGLAADVPELVRIVPSPDPRAWADAILADERGLGLGETSWRVGRARAFAHTQLSASRFAAEWSDLILKLHRERRRHVSGPLAQIATAKGCPFRHGASCGCSSLARCRRGRAEFDDGTVSLRYCAECLSGVKSLPAPRHV